ncbi:CDP-diacylglycerol--glycerol-3-phosphate 3-phosphatidyltransferase, mitochondrial-like [Gigantopelta aegis]|uniref:CDP-diacylglycerol--glycerol-3-phosphate 3-phosphatidyltransferase, mitochondrial-like n=1 Tax=Gigantopelta aegis TaxID=1735272 RepID=UPI001B88CBE5|nr:CDP-diacylglycerol--glycerol-3-phosphate 3-phosphatidyltransferase, mitochondrial-like [Gigantopelta aegis]
MADKVLRKMLLRHRSSLISRTFSSCSRRCSGERLQSRLSPGQTKSAQHTNTSAQNYFSWIGKSSPCFQVKGEQVLVLTEPTQFYEILKLKTRKAKERITFASLYLGTGHLEQVECVREACENARLEGNTNFQVNILLDFNRGSRGSDCNSRTMLLPLLEEYPEMVHVSLYHTPDLRGLLKRVVPERFNETIGLTHVKVYLFDDSFIVSGANLSDSYFTNRQDRYILFNSCKQLADFFHQLVETVSTFSFQLGSNNSISLCRDWNIHPYKDSDDGTRFKWSARQKIQDVISRTFQTQVNLKENSDELSANEDSSEPDSATNSSEYDTWIYPLIQMGPLGISHDEFVTLTLLRKAAARDVILLSSGYFNLTDHYMHVILEESLAKYRILMASPEVNGFFKARGIAGYVPHVYIYIARQFYRRIVHSGQNRRLQLFEYFRDKWTFHVKGLWYYLPNNNLPSMTMIGSTNFGYRSVYRDLECQLAVVTENPQLAEQLREEHARLYQSSVPVTSDLFQRRDRHVPLWAKIVTKIIKNFF